MALIIPQYIADLAKSIAAHKKRETGPFTVNLPDGGIILTCFYSADIALVYDQGKDDEWGLPLYPCYESSFERDINWETVLSGLKNLGREISKALQTDIEFMKVEMEVQKDRLNNLCSEIMIPGPSAVGKSVQFYNRFDLSKLHGPHPAIIQSEQENGLYNLYVFFSDLPILRTDVRKFDGDLRLSLFTDTFWKDPQ